MKTAEDIEAYLLKLGLHGEQMAPNLWVCKVDGQENLVLSIAGPVLLFRMKMMPIPPSSREQLFRRLLELNTTDLVHGAYGLENDAVVLGAALALENMDFNEFSVVIDEITMTVPKHHQTLSAFRPTAA